MSKSEIKENKFFKKRVSQAWVPHIEGSNQKFDCDKVTSKVLQKRNTLRTQNSLKSEVDSHRGSNFGMSEEGCQFLRRI